MSLPVMVNNFNNKYIMLKQAVNMKKAVIICAAGMSSSLMAKKVTDYLQQRGKEIELDAISASEGLKTIESGEFDLFLISPQTRNYFDKFSDAAKKVNKPIESIPPQAYIPIPMGIEKLANIVLQHL